MWSSPPSLRSRRLGNMGYRRCPDSMYCSQWRRGCVGRGRDAAVALRIDDHLTLAPVRIAPSPERAGDSGTDAEADPGAIEIGRRREEHRQIIVIRPPPVDLGRVVHQNIDHRPIYRLDSDNGPSLEIRSCGVDLTWPASTLRGQFPMPRRAAFPAVRFRALALVSGWRRGGTASSTAVRSQRARHRPTLRSDL